jgi:C1A family cysteine protease
VFGTQVDSDFQNFAGKNPVRRQDPEKVVGGHAMFVLGYRTDPKTGNRIFRNVNSWGTSWGDGGLFWADESFYADASDVYVLQVG